MSPRIFGLTGVIGSGKSTVAEIFRGLGAAIIDADILARDVVAPGTEGLKQVLAEFGPEMALPEGGLNRKRLGDLVFADPKKKALLEDILHPKIRALFLQKLQEATSSVPPPRLILYVVPLLFESRFTYEELEGVIVVSAPRDVCIARIMARDSCSRELATKKLDSQIPIEQKEVRANYVIRNIGGATTLRDGVKKVFQGITEA